jgi:Snare region anchored in the vesicle membrane C-terminus
MEELHRNVRRVLLESRRHLEALEAASSNPRLDPAASAAVQQAFRENLLQIARDLDLMRGALTREPPARRHVWRARIGDFDDQLAELRTDDARVANRFRAIATEVSVREELFQRRNAVAARGDAVIGFGPEGGGGGYGGDGGRSGMGVADEHRSLTSSHAGVSGILATGASALDALVGQRIRLKGARRKVMDVMNTTDTGRRLIAQIERRDSRDMILLYALMLCILLLMGAAVVYKHARRHAAQLV